jgi:hypothetical protein
VDAELEAMASAMVASTAEGVEVVWWSECKEEDVEVEEFELEPEPGELELKPGGTCV